MISYDFDETKFRELVLYIAAASADDPRFESVKLNKILFYADFGAYLELGQPITGATYRKMSEGPAPAEMLPQRRILLDSGAAKVKFRRYFGWPLQSIVPLRPACREVFAPGELEIVDQVVSGLWPMTAREAADFSHRELGWQAADPGAEIPYPTAWLSPGPVSQEAEEYAAKVAARLDAA